MDLEVHLTRIERVIADARTLPLSASVVVNRLELEDLLADLRAAVPNEIRQARWIIKERDDLIAVAEREAEQIRDDAHAEQERIVSSAEVVRAAQREADRILEDAREQARVLRLQADDYVDGKLAGFEGILERTLSAVSRGREQVRTRAVGADGEVVPSGDDEDTGDYGEAPIQFYDQERTDP